MRISSRNGNVCSLPSLISKGYPAWHRKPGPDICPAPHSKSAASRGFWQLGRKMLGIYPTKLGMYNQSPTITNNQPDMGKYVGFTGMQLDLKIYVWYPGLFMLVPRICGRLPMVFVCLLHIAFLLIHIPSWVHLQCRSQLNSCISNDSGREVNRTKRTPQTAVQLLLYQRCFWASAIVLIQSVCL